MEGICFLSNNIELNFLGLYVYYVTMVLYGAILHIYEVSRSIKFYLFLFELPVCPLDYCITVCTLVISYHRMVSKWLHVYEIGFEPSVTIKKARYRVGDFISILNRDGHNNNRS